MNVVFPLLAMGLQLAPAQASEAAHPSSPDTATAGVANRPAPAVEPVASAPAESAPSATPPATSSAPAVAPAPARERGLVETYGEWQLGFGAGMASGFGISARRWFGEADALQLNLAPYLSRTNQPDYGSGSSDEGYSLEASLSLGLTWLHELYRYRMDQNREIKLLSYVAGSTYLSLERQEMDMMRYDASKDSSVLARDRYSREERAFRLGSGAATEFSLRRFSVVLGLGLGSWYEAVNGDFGIAGDIQVGTHFRF